MQSNIKFQLKRSAIQHPQVDYRLSVPTNTMEHNRFSFSSNQVPAVFRLSDMTSLNQVGKRSHFIESNQLEEVTLKTPSSLLSTLSLLESKLSQAKKQLDITGNSYVNTSVIEINSFKDSSSTEEKWGGESMIEKQDESTINLESNRRLLSIMRSKEMLIRASKMKTYYLAQVVKGVAGINERALEHLHISLEVLKNCRQITLPNQTKIKRSKGIVSKFFQNHSKPILALDLDETLVHCDVERNSFDDIEIDIKYDQTTVEKMFISIRPYAISFLKRMKKYFEIVVFTASDKAYADAILNEIDPDLEYISHRLYRQHCVKLHDKVYAKDLRIINKDLSRIVLVDNSPFSFLYQFENGIPILPYNGGEDSELLSLEKYLQQLQKYHDVRELNRNTFKLQKYGQFQECEQLVKELYCGDKYF